jgi:purine nucleosidase
MSSNSGTKIKKKIIIDTDPGIDDAQALCYAFGHPELDVVALTTVFGNVSVETATANALKLCDLCERHDVPVAQGHGVPSVVAPRPFPDFVHGVGGFGDAELSRSTTRGADDRHAARLIVDLVRQHPHELTLIPVGPLTNIAAALELDPGIVDLVHEVIVMGGAVEVKGNVSDHAEANIWNDPHAAHVVLSAPWPRLTMIGLDVTFQVNMPTDYLGGLGAVSKQTGAFLQASSEYYAQYYNDRFGLDGCIAHDLTAVAYAANPHWFVKKTATFAVVTDDGHEQLGKTVATEYVPQHHDHNDKSRSHCSAYVVEIIEAQQLLDEFKSVIANLP